MKNKNSLYIYRLTVGFIPILKRTVKLNFFCKKCIYTFLHDPEGILFVLRIKNNIFQMIFILSVTIFNSENFYASMKGHKNTCGAQFYPQT